mmetsp:Transcript_1854/g.1991  ORF Transcript_1854/g.1991 Transcript_1854/m.1991 type:complete len:350 (+) Transcript_1854:150-1199(+)|eukprot:CAMPEP_0119035990 /NCGR_PEP_ID=MMETSP1177-20130426/3315_1 /TAXON_ID=2985 /ORGANISM="Ochromonas sp, Strain CCMP1899" /LENGTH=349 /DNA_ID=CAMNT_0006995013 /DNA_START=120 /DNA_END=1169 /DNA_ORIENTATION=-
MTDVKRIGDSGIHTVEGNLAGARAGRLTKQREKQQKEYEAAKNKIKEQNAAGVGRIDDKFNAATDSLEQEFRRRTVGLVTADDFRKAKADTEDAGTENISLKKRQEREQEAIDMKKRDRALKRKKLASSLSFNDDEGEGDHSESNGLDNSGSAPTIRRPRKDPSAETSFLPDKERDMERLRERERLQQEWIAQQTVVKNEMLQITYSYWDGQGHRRVIQVRKGTTIGRYLELVKQQISTEFHDVRMISSENFLYIKEDLIIPHHFTFYDLIVTKARGKSGPLFHFDVHDDIRMISDATVEKDESHPGKVVQRHWYERNKHIFPASRWEVYDPTVERDSYSIHGSEVEKQ